MIIQKSFRMYTCVPIGVINATSAVNYYACRVPIAKVLDC